MYCNGSLQNFFIKATKKGIKVIPITSNDIVFTCAYDLFADSWHYEMGKVYKNLRTYVPNTVSTFNKKRFNEFVELLKKAKTLQL
jgi:hypothetical protein